MRFLSKTLKSAGYLPKWNSYIISNPAQRKWVIRLFRKIEEQTKSTGNPFFPRYLFHYLEWLYWHEKWTC
jgi:hypothetical protein